MTRLVDILLDRAADEPDRVALAVGEEVLTWRDLAGRVNGTAARLAADGVRPGDHVILAASTSPAFVSGYFATHLLGAVALPVDPRVPASRLAFIADAVEPRAIFLARPLDLPGREVRHVDELGRAEHAAAGPPSGATTGNDPEASADILFTSGTTGKPKGVVLSHRAIGAAARNINAFIGNGPDDREVVPLPLSHSFGLGRLRCQILAGGMIALVDGFTSAGRLFEALRRWRATGLSFVPAGLAVLFQTTGDKLGELADTLRWVEIGSASMPTEHKHRLMELLPTTRICMHYGLTEASRSAFIEFHQAKAADRLNSIGKPTPGVAIRVIDGHGCTCPPGERGRIVIRGETLMSGYWQDEAASAASSVDGWLISGDVGHADRDGWLFLDAREKDLINVGGREVSPLEIERILEELDEVATCACVGVPDPQGITGSAVKAFLVPAPDVTELPRPIVLAKHLRGRIEPYKMPIAFTWIEEHELPRTSSGKLQRAVLGERR